MISWGKVVSVILYLLWFPSYDVINDVIMSDANCTPCCEPRSIAASLSLTYTLITYNPRTHTRHLHAEQ